MSNKTMFSSYKKAKRLLVELGFHHPKFAPGIWINNKNKDFRIDLKKTQKGNIRLSIRTPKSEHIFVYHIITKLNEDTTAMQFQSIIDLHKSMKWGQTIIHL